DAQRQGSNREGRSRREGLVRSFHGEVVDRGERRGVREDGAGVADDGRAGTAHARRPGRAGKHRKQSARRLGGQTDRRSGGQQGGKYVRNAQLLYWSAEGAGNPGRSETQLAKAHRLTRSVNDALVCRVTFAAPVNPV